MAYRKSMDIRYYQGQKPSADGAKRTIAFEGTRKNEAHARLRAETAELIWWDYDIALDRWIYVSPPVKRISGFSPTEWTNFQFWVNRLHEDDRERAVQYYTDCTNRGGTHQLEYRFLAKDGRIVWLRDVFSIEMNGGPPVRRRGFTEDITAQRTAEEALLEREARLRRISALTFDIAYCCHKSADSSYSIDWISGGVERITEYSEDEIKGMGGWRCLVIDEDLPVFDKSVIGLAPGQKETCELQLRPKTGEIVWVHSSAECVSDSTAPGSARLYGALLDITERKKAEEQMQASLREKEALLKEIHHRVKNNFAVMGCMVALHAEYSKDDTTRRVLEECQDCIRSLALVHEMLHQSGNVASIKMDEYLPELINYLTSSRGSLETMIALQTDIEGIALDPDAAIPLGFIVTELITNCFKHAFQGRSDGKVRVDQRSNGEQGYELVVRDNGVGIPDIVNPEMPQSVGLDLVDSFVSQLKGTVEIVRDCGTLVRVKFQERRRRDQVRESALLKMR